ncbi:MAG: hypothetical protein KDG89_11095 [Geminicoccaceae bacterium]|nr:hypothetical protein [Geminicoccaceae bacterium]
MPNVHVHVDRPTPHWQATIVRRLEGIPHVRVGIATRSAAPFPRSWRWATRRCQGLVPVPLTGAALPRDEGKALVLDLSSRGGVPDAWRLWDQHDRPLAAPFPFCTAGRRDGLAEVRLIDGEGRLVDRACLDAGERIDLLLDRAYAWGGRLVERGISPRLAGEGGRCGAIALPSSSAPLEPPQPWRIVAGDLLRQAKRRLADWTLDETWAIGVLDRPIVSLLDDDALADARWIAAPKGVYYADPFGVPGQGTILCERFDHGDGKGRLVALDAGVPPFERPLDLGIPGHASFPFLVEAEGRLLCLPESSADRRLALWRRTADGSWQPAATVAEGIAAIDPVLFSWQGRWWLAYTDGDLGASDNLCLLHAPSPQGPWRPHPANPVKVDVRSSRGAGTPFVAGRALYRPAQDCLGGYGQAIVINRVHRLDPETYLEEPVRRIAPDGSGPYRHGAHTLSAWGERTLIDAKRHGMVPAALWRRVRGRLAPALRRPALEPRGARA